MKENITFRLPKYDNFVKALDDLQLSVCASELHGNLCGYLALCAPNEGETYMRALIPHGNQKKESKLMLFDVFTISQHQIYHFDVDFELMIPDVSEKLELRLQAFSTWCGGFIDGVVQAGIAFEKIKNKDLQNCVLHLTEFANFDFEDLILDKEDEQSFNEILDYTRMSVLNIHNEFAANDFTNNTSH